jgi:tritrans,polycis-undecaprenyl-diphosphate synthase [geranylgeranyl-diphosphate specific]
MLPETIAFIPDGNRRYSKKLSFNLGLGYQKGCAKAEEALHWCLDKKIKNAVFYAMSLDNFAKRVGERGLLMRVFSQYFNKMAKSDDIHDNEVRVSFAGKRELFPSKLRGVIENLEEVTQGYDKRNVCICLGYDGRQEIVDAVKGLIVTGEKISPEAIKKHLYTDLPDPDLLIRTGATSRLSGFLTWQTTYSELYFSNKLWPEFSRKDFEDALSFYSSITRNFGR